MNRLRAWLFYALRVDRASMIAMLKAKGWHGEAATYYHSSIAGKGILGRLIFKRHIRRSAQG